MGTFHMKGLKASGDTMTDATANLIKCDASTEWKWTAPGATPEQIGATVYATCAHGEQHFHCSVLLNCSEETTVQCSDCGNREEMGKCPILIDSNNNFDDHITASTAATDPLVRVSFMVVFSICRRFTTDHIFRTDALNTNVTKEHFMESRKMDRPSLSAPE